MKKHPKITTNSPKKCKICSFLRSIWKILHQTEFFYTGAGCGACDKYEVWACQVRPGSCWTRHVWDVHVLRGHNLLQCRSRRFSHSWSQGPVSFLISAVLISQPYTTSFLIKSMNIFACNLWETNMSPLRRCWKRPRQCCPENRIQC